MGNSFKCNACGGSGCSFICHDCDFNSMTCGIKCDGFTVCPTCEGSGKLELVVKCESCNGKGCQAFMGSGQVPEMDMCWPCEGTGYRPLTDAEVEDLVYHNDAPKIFDNEFVKYHGIEGVFNTLIHGKGYFTFNNQPVSLRAKRGE